jgi:L-seryl-tRNA(Ser) seleniumtransferase
VVLSGAAGDIHEKLRAGEPPVVGRIADDEVWLDVRCVADSELTVLAHAARAAVTRSTVSK